MKTRRIYLESIFLCFQSLILAASLCTNEAKCPAPSTTRPKLQGNGTSTVKGPPKGIGDAVDNSCNVISVCVRENAELDCPLVGNPAPLYEWFKGSERINQVWPRFEGTDQVRLIIRSVTHEDSGTYRCEAVNGFGSKNFSIQLNVTGEDPLKNNFLKTTNKRSYNVSSPEIKLDNLPADGSVTKVKGSTLLVKCEARGSPTPNVTWFKDKQNLTSSKDPSATLKLFNLTDKDDGKYRCEATNKWGKSTYEMVLKVSEAWQGAAEILELNPSNLTLFPGQSGTITCLARQEGATLPLMLWVKKVDPTLESNRTSKLLFHDGTYYEALNRTDVRETGRNIYETVLPINNATPADAGTYGCAVVGTMGFNHSTAQVIIQADPHLGLSVQKQKSATVHQIVFWSFTFLILVVVLTVGLSRLNACRGPLKNSSMAGGSGGPGGGGARGAAGSLSVRGKKITSSASVRRQGKKGPAVVMMTVGDESCSSSRTQVPKRSPGETLSTTLTQTQNDVLQPLMLDNNNSRTISTSDSARRGGVGTHQWVAGAVNYSASGKIFCEHLSSSADRSSGHYSSNNSSGSCCSRGNNRCSFAYSDSASSQNVNYVRGNDDSSALYFVNGVDRMPPLCNGSIANSGVYRAAAATRQRSRRDKYEGKRRSYSPRNHSDHHQHQHQHFHHHHRHDIDYALPLSATHLPVPAPSWESLSSSEESSKNSVIHYLDETPRHNHHHHHHHHYRHHSQPSAKIKLSLVHANNDVLSR